MGSLNKDINLITNLDISNEKRVKNIHNFNRKHME